MYISMYICMYTGERYDCVVLLSDCITLQYNLLLCIYMHTLTTYNVKECTVCIYNVCAFVF